MSGETKTSGWSVDTAMAHIIELIESNDKRYEHRFNASDKALLDAITGLTAVLNERSAASEKAIDKSDVNQEKWRANANEWRAAMVDRENRFAARVETDAEFRAMRAEIQGLRESRSTDEGRGAGSAALWGYIAGGIGIILTIIAVAVSVLKK